MPKGFLETLQTMLRVWQEARMYQCQRCDEHFNPSRSDAKYCSDACRKRAWRDAS